MHQKAIQGLLSRFRWSSGPSIFDRFLADLNRALSALFPKSGLKNGSPKREPWHGDRQTTGDWQFEENVLSVTGIWTQSPHLCPRSSKNSSNLDAQSLSSIKSIDLLSSNCSASSDQIDRFDALEALSVEIRAVFRRSRA